MGAGEPATHVGTGVIDAAAEPATFDFSTAGSWSVLVLLDGTPVERVELPAPGKLGSASLVSATLIRRADAALGRRRLAEHLRTRLGTPSALPPANPPISVVVCTHRRPEHLPRVLAALGALEPAPLEVIVVDNAPGDRDCRALVEAAGFRYVREDRRGLDNARNAGIGAARGEVIAFTDDDCVPSPGWLTAFGGLFDDPSVGAATGPMFPYLLDTPARIRMERAAGMTRGFSRAVFDWQTISAVHAGAVGVGANMAFRASVLADLGAEPFPPELDAGTPTESGGDTFVIARVIARGHRVIYAPEMFGFHLHREDPDALRRAVRGYGAGVSATMTKLLVENGEAEAWRGWWWLVKQYLRTERRRLIGRADSDDARLSREYIVGGILGPARWRRSIRAQRDLLGTALPQRTADRPVATAPVGTAAPHEPPALSVVIPTHRRPEVLARCLDSLARQSGAPSFEVLVVDDARPPGLDPRSLRRSGLDVRVLQSNGGGASAARNLGARSARAPLLLFLDDDMVAEPTLLLRHVSAHAGEPTLAVVGAYPPAPAAPGLMASAVAFWWSDLFESMRRSAGASFVFLLSGNLSMPRGAFLDVGGFAEDIPYRREDWELGMRWLRAGHAIVYEPRASARHEFRLQTAARLRGAELEGYGDAVLAARYPGSRGALPLVAHRPRAIGSPLRRLGFAALARPVVQRLAGGTLDALEAAHLRLAWQRLLKPLQIAAYTRGLERGGYVPAGEDEETIVEFELLADEQLEQRGPVAPTLRISLAGEEVALVRPREGHWGPQLAEQILEAAGPERVARVAAARGWLPTSEPAIAAWAAGVAVFGCPPAEATASWRAIIAAADRDVELVAVRLHGSAPADTAWLREALVAFDGERVAAVFGQAIADDRPLDPLYLHDRAAPPAFDVGEAPDYLIVRSGALRALGPAAVAAAQLGPLASALALIERILDSGAVIARRDIHGLQPLGRMLPAAEQGRAWAAARVSHADSVPRALVRGGAGLLATLAWDLLKHRGHLDRSRLAAASGAAQGGVRAAAARRVLRSGR